MGSRTRDLPGCSISASTIYATAKMQSVLNEQDPTVQRRCVIGAGWVLATLKSVRISNGATTSHRVEGCACKNWTHGAV
jgi:hypothetical protein